MKYRSNVRQSKTSRSLKHNWGFLILIPFLYLLHWLVDVTLCLQIIPREIVWREITWFWGAMYRPRQITRPLNLSQYAFRFWICWSISLHGSNWVSAKLRHVNWFCSHSTSALKIKPCIPSNICFSEHHLTNMYDKISISLYVCS